MGEHKRKEAFNPVSALCDMGQAVPRSFNLFDPPNQIYGLPVFTNENLFRINEIQFRFPRSKKKRIRRKWARRIQNYKPTLEYLAYFDEARRCYYMHPEALAQFRKQLEKKVNMNHGY